MEATDSADVGSRPSSNQHQQQRKREGRSLHSGSRGQDRPSTISSTIHRPKSEQGGSQQRDYHGKRGDEAHRSIRPSHRDRSSSGKSGSSSTSKHRHSRPRDDRREVHRSRSRPSNSRSDTGSKRERSRDPSREWGQASGEGEKEEEDLRRILERRRRETAKSRLSHSPSSSEEEGEMKDPKERDVPDSPASSSSSSGSSNVPAVQASRGDVSDISDVSAGASSPVATKGSRWLSKDSGSEEDDTAGAPSYTDTSSGKVVGSKAVDSTVKSSAFTHRSIGGYGVHQEEMSSESDEEEEAPATKEELLKELGVVREEEKGEDPSSPGTPPLPDYFPGIHGCRNVENYEWLNRIEEGTYGVVFRGRDKRTGRLETNTTQQ